MVDMNVKQRVRTCRLIEKANNNKKAAKGLGIRDVSKFETVNVKAISGRDGVYHGIYC